MPLVTGSNDEFEHLQVERIFTDSSERQAGGTVADYVFVLKKRLQNVIGIELTAFAIPSSVTPTFSLGVNDSIDFELSQGAVTKVFHAVMPSNSFEYQNISVPYLNYVSVLQQVLNRAIFSDPDFGTAGTTPAFFWTQCVPELKTVIGVSGGAVLRLLFASGLHNKTNARTVMGFNQSDYVVPAGSYIFSDFTVNTEPFDHIEVHVDEFREYSPIARIYNGYPGGSVVLQDASHTRFRYLNDAPPRILEKLTIRMRLPNGTPIENAFKNNHSLTFTAICLAHNANPVPRYIKVLQSL
jgi:hypothetical protein